MRLWAEVFNPAGERLGIIALMNANVTRELDAAGELSFEVAATDYNAYGLLQLRRRVAIYRDNPARGKELVGEGVLLRRNLDISAGSQQVLWTAADLLQELREANTFRGLVYDDAAIDDVLRDLVARVAGWRVDVDLTGVTYTTTSRQFDGQSVLEAIRAVCEGAGLHFRLSGTRRLQVGVFGADSGVRVTTIRQADASTRTNRNLLLIESLSMLTDGYDVVNVIEPIWASGMGALTLRQSTRTSPYTISTYTRSNGQLGYLLEDAASIALYGRSEAVISMQDAPYLSDFANAADVLYDWAAARLARTKEPQRSYGLNAVKIDKRLLPGDEVELVYQGVLTTPGGVAMGYEDINEDLYVIRVTESYAVDGARVNLEVSNIDYEPIDAANLLADALIQQSGSGLGQKLAANLVTDAGSGTVSYAASLSVTFDVPELAFDVSAVSIQITRQADTVQNLRVTLDGAEVAAGLMALASDADTVTLTALITGTIPGTHTVQVSALYGSATVDVGIEAVAILVQ